MNYADTVTVYDETGHLIWVGDAMRFCEIFATCVFGGKDISMLTFGLRGNKYTYEYVLNDMLNVINRRNENGS